MTRDGTCTLCGSTAYVQRDYDTNTVFFVCPICGRYELQALDSSSKFDYNHLASYFTYHRYSDANDMENEYRYHTVRKKEECDRYNEEFHNGINNAGRPVHIDNHIVETWYPKTFAERVDHILLYLNSKAKHIGQPASLCYEEMISALFIDRYDIVRSHNSGKISTHKRRDSNDCQQEATYMLDCLKAQGFIHYVFGISDEKAVDITITPEGYTRIDELQKYSAHGRNVLVAMKFGAGTNKLREAIRKGITDAEYHAIFIEESYALVPSALDFKKYISNYFQASMWF